MLSSIQKDLMLDLILAEVNGDREQIRQQLIHLLEKDGIEAPEESGDLLIDMAISSTLSD